ncbi:Gfo/Idh/MocA family protein [Effusibacillus lacus]|uniref:Oxidoreductase n=1 Tax=Effusibacillus lacus TaxID=1348429 RepID=A0A292YKQ1_9BACL|nr:Gfo/Idh/MocA family oxidoreductase [Effusibacillus lacus]TCS75923.1 putative dehydrogenase [Effusibacillus lacus]GAX91687.1 oxidoreductase [Effusibacillus lacus]
MSRKVRWGVLSTANIACEQLIPAIHRAVNAEVVAIASGSGQAQSAAERLEIPKFYDSYQSLLDDSEIDAVYIPLPNHLHREWTSQAARAKKHVLCEKPAALNTREVREILDECGKSNVLFMEAFMYRFHPQHQKVKDLIQDGVIGGVKLMRASFSFFMENREGNIRLASEMGGGAVYDIGCYCINSIRYILGREPVSVRAFGEIENGVDTDARAILNFANGIHAIFDCSFNMAMRNEYEVVGTKGTIRVPQAFRPDIHGGRGIIEIHQELAKKEIAIVANQYQQEVEHFSNCVLSGQQPEYSGENTLKNMKVIDAVLQAIKTGEEVAIDE